MEEKEWVDFKEVKQAVSMQMVLDRYKITGLKKVGDELRGPCPIHKGAGQSRHFCASLTKNAFQCFASDCKARGNVLDFVAAIENCTVRDAALKLKEWFMTGDSETSPAEVLPDKIKPGIYEHFKGNSYMVLGVALHSESNEALVIYRALYGDYLLSARPLGMFTETIARGEYSGPRFKLIKEL
jgi:hypothetical protein